MALRAALSSSNESNDVVQQLLAARVQSADLRKHLVHAEHEYSHALYLLCSHLRRTLADTSLRHHSASLSLREALSSIGVQAGIATVRGDGPTNSINEDASIRRVCNARRRTYDILNAEIDEAIDGSHVKLFVYPQRMGLRHNLNIARRYTKASHLSWKLECELFKLLPAHVFTNNPDEADFYVVPNAIMGHFGTYKTYVPNTLAPYLTHILHRYPFFNRSGGRDHLLVYGGDTGPMCDCNLRWRLDAEPVARQMIDSMLRIGYYGQRGNASIDDCGWRDGQDIALPMFNDFHLRPPPMAWQESFRSTIVANIHFHGKIWGPRESVTCSNVEKQIGFRCNPGVRSWMKDYMEGESCNLQSPAWPAQQLAQDAAEPVRRRCSFQNGSSTSGLYNLCPAALACWSVRLFDSLDRGHIPVVLADSVVQPFEELLDYESFAVTLDTAALMRGDLSGLDRLHHEAERVVKACTHSIHAPSCTSLEPVQMMIRAREVAPFFSYTANSSRSAWGLFMLELLCRKRKRLRGIPPPQWINEPCTSSRGAAAAQEADERGVTPRAAIGSARTTRRAPGQPGERRWRIQRDPPARRNAGIY